ncbi:unnamed protein product, partial [Effrenium voratum]
ENYIKDLVERNGITGKSAIPMSKDMAEPEVENDITADEVQAAQKVAEEWVQKVGLQAFKFLNGTSAAGLTFTPDTGVGWDGADRAGLQVYMDSSFAPGGALSHGCVMVKWQDSVIAWKSSRQEFPALSTALINEIEEGANYVRYLF